MAKIVGTENGELIFGPNEADRIFGLGGDDKLEGMGGDDFLFGGDGRDILKGNDGNDVLFGGLGDDRLLGGSGRNTADYRLSLNGITATYHAGIWEIYGDGYDRALDVGNITGSRYADSIVAGYGDNLLKGMDGSDHLGGGWQNDRLEGGRGGDRLHGSQGDDVLVGGIGRDVMHGGPGADTFVFETTRDSLVSNPDFIKALVQGLDRIDLSVIDANTGTVEDDAAVFIGSADFTGAAGELRFASTMLGGQAATLVELDIDGNGAADFAVIINGDVPLTETDFIL